MLTGESVALWPELAIVVGPPLGMAVFLLSMSGLLISRYRCEAPFVCWHRSLKEFFHGLWHRSHEPDLVSPVRSGRPRATARTLPGYHPIAWREYRASITTKPTTHVALGVSLLALVYWMQSANFSNSVTGLAVLLKCILLFVGILQVQSLAAAADNSPHDQRNPATEICGCQSRPLSADDSIRCTLTRQPHQQLLAKFLGFLSEWNTAKSVARGNPRAADSLAATVVYAAVGRILLRFHPRDNARSSNLCRSPCRLVARTDVLHCDA
jgi:hypothetical protein